MADATTSAASNTASSAMSSLDPISAGVNVAATIANTVAGISDMAKRRNAEIGLNYLTAQQKNELAIQLSKAQTQTERMQILSSAIVSYAIANENNAARSNNIMYLAAAGLSVAFLVMAIILLKDK